MADDPIAALLRKAPLTNAQRADLWDAFQESGDADALTTRLQGMAIPDTVKASLWDLKAGAAPTTTPTAPEPEQSYASMAGDVAIGAAKGVGNTVFGLGKMVRDYTPIGRISDAIMPGAFDERPPEITPTNTAQKIGYGAEQLGEFFVPAGNVAKLGKVGEAVKAGAVTLAQTGSPASAGVSAGLTAAIPAAGAGVRMAGSLREGAEKNVAQALGATKEWAKDTATKIAPEMLARGVKGSRTAMLERATAETSRAGAAIDDAYKAATAAGQEVDGLVVRGSLQAAREGLMATTEAGKRAVIPGTERVVKRLEKLDTFVESLGPNIPVEQAAHIKRTLDKIVAKAGLFGPKATASATDAADAWATREASGAFRTLLSDVPDVARLNKEYAFWKGLKDVLKETEKRTQAQSGGLQAGIAASAGAASGFASGDDLGSQLTGAFAGAAMGRQFVKLMQSPYWRTSVSAPLKMKMADALASGSAGQASSVASRIISALPSEARLVLAQ